MKKTNQIKALSERLDNQEALITALFSAITKHGIAVLLPRQNDPVVRPLPLMTDLIAERYADEKVRPRRSVPTPNGRTHWTRTESEAALSWRKQGVSHAEIARRLGRTERGVSSHLANRRHGR